MKLVAQAKLNNAKLRAERTTPFFREAEILFKQTKLDQLALPQPPEKKDESPSKKKILTVVMTTDKGMCGSINTNINRYVKQLPGARDMSFVVIGEKGVVSLERAFIKDLVPFSVHTAGLKFISFLEIGAVAERITKQKYDAIQIIYNRFGGGMKFLIDTIHIPSASLMATHTQNLAAYTFEEMEGEFFQDLHEFYLSTALNYVVYQNQASEMASRRNAMDTANKNAEEMIRMLTIQFNKLRQATITIELTEIVSGASVVQELTS